MLKKILIILFYTCIVTIFAAYFYFASSLKAKGEQINEYKSMDIIILDSMDNRFINKNIVQNIITKSTYNPSDALVNNINVSEIEGFLNTNNVIKNSDVAIDRNGMLYISIQQRRPIIRIANQHGGFYIDDEQYVFPLVKTFSSYVPLVTGNIPIDLKEGTRGKASETKSGWTKQILQLSQYLNNNPIWNKQIQQIHIEEDGSVLMFTKVGDQTIKFGDLNNIEYKFQKLTSFYKSVIPLSGWELYSDIDISIANQIICKKRKKN